MHEKFRDGQKNLLSACTASQSRLQLLRGSPGLSGYYVVIIYVSRGSAVLIENIDTHIKIYMKKIHKYKVAIIICQTALILKVCSLMLAKNEDTET